MTRVGSQRHSKKKNLCTPFVLLSNQIAITSLNIQCLMLVIGAQVKQSHYKPVQTRRVEAPRFQDNRHMKVVTLSALSTGRLYPNGNIPGTHFC